MLMELAVTDSLTIAGAAVSTGWGSTGVWVITNPHGKCIHIEHNKAGASFNILNVRCLISNYHYPLPQNYHSFGLYTDKFEPKLFTQLVCSSVDE